MTEGMKSSEFWGKTALQVIALLVMFGVVDLEVPAQEQVALAVAAGLEAVYTIARGWKKAWSAG